MTGACAPVDAGRIMTINASMLTRLQIEDFVYREAALLDDWRLDDWLTLYTADCRYEIGPTGKPDARELSPDTSLFLVADNRFRLEQRVIRLKKPTAHAEYPHSRSRRLYSNVRVLEDQGTAVKAAVSFATFRSARHIVQTYFGQIDYLFQASGSGDERNFRVAHKRVTLDLDSLVPHGKVTIIF
jgi:p-cumate 2,3-dioxygenase subunit beta